MFPLPQGSGEDIGSNGLNAIADKVSDKIDRFVDVFERLGISLVLVFAVLGAVKIYSRWPPPMSPPRQQQTTPTVSTVAEDEKEKTGSPSSDGGKSAAGTERTALDHEKTVLTRKAGGV